jgi:hypothetical protein
MNKHDVYIITGRGDAKNWLAKKLFGFDAHINPSSVSDDNLPVILTADKWLGIVPKIVGLAGMTFGKITILTAAS